MLAHAENLISVHSVRGFGNLRKITVQGSEYGKAIVHHLFWLTISGHGGHGGQVGRTPFLQSDCHFEKLATADGPANWSRPQGTSVGLLSTPTTLIKAQTPQPGELRMIVISATIQKMVERWMRTNLPIMSAFKL